MEFIFSVSVFGCFPTPLILIGVPAFSPCGVEVVTVILLSASVPLPDCTTAISIGSAAKAPTISHSGALFANDSDDCGNLSSFSIFLIVLYALPTLP